MKLNHHKFYIKESTFTLIFKTSKFGGVLKTRICVWCSTTYWYL